MRKNFFSRDQVNKNMNMLKSNNWSTKLVQLQYSCRGRFIKVRKWLALAMHVLMRTMAIKHGDNGWYGAEDF